MPTNDPRTDRELVMAHREAGDDSARETLILRYSGLARAIARRFARRGMAHDDVLQSGYLGLIQAVDRYDPARACRCRRTPPARSRARSCTSSATAAGPCACRVRCRS